MPFIADYIACQPVVVRKDGKAFGIPCAFVAFDDGVSWCDDGVLQEGYCSTHPYHHLYGPVSVTDGSVTCDGWSFESVEVDDREVAVPWDWCTSRVTDWISTHEKYEFRLREDRRS